MKKTKKTKVKKKKNSRGNAKNLGFCCPSK